MCVATDFRLSVVALAVLCSAYRVFAAEISAISCTGGVNEPCTDENAHAVCDSVTSKCKCDTNYLLTTNKDGCTLSIESVVCSTHGVQCISEDRNSECAAGGKCACITGYIPNRDFPNDCLKVIGKRCTVTADCSSDDANAVCDTAATTKTCKCKDGYQDSDNVCTKTLGIACTTETAATKCNVTNSECGTGNVCSCVDGYVDTSDLCKQVMEKTCSVVGDCAGLANAKCTDSKCGCNTDYVPQGMVCRKGDGVTCDNGDQCVTNAECKETKCSCKSGFMYKDMMCEAENSAQAVVVSTGLFVVMLQFFL